MRCQKNKRGCEDGRQAIVSHILFRQLVPVDGAVVRVVLDVTLARAAAAEAGRDLARQKLKRARG